MDRIRIHEWAFKRKRGTTLLVGYVMADDTVQVFWASLRHLQNVRGRDFCCNGQPFRLGRSSRVFREFMQKRYPDFNIHDPLKTLGGRCPG